MRIDVLDHGYVQLVESWGSDESIIRAARMSTGGAFNGWGPPPCAPTCSSWTPGDGDRIYGVCTCGNSQKQGDEKLLRHLYVHQHLTPFEMCGLQLEVKAPIFVVREWHRHRTQSYNEMSGRYTQLPDERYLPHIDRLLSAGQSASNKQVGDQPLSMQTAEMALSVIRAQGYASYGKYVDLLKLGVAREIARLVLPVNQYTVMRAQAVLRNWLGFLSLRCPKDAQWEIRQYAEAVAKITQEAFPRTYELWKEEFDRKHQRTTAGT